jgi:hypothetical protein
MQSMKCGSIRNTRENSCTSLIGARVHEAAFGAWARGAGAGANGSMSVIAWFQQSLPRPYTCSGFNGSRLPLNQEMSSRLEE